jgi:hypothetical protein
MDIRPQKIELDHRDVKVMSNGIDRKAVLNVSATVKFLDDEEGLMVATEHLLHVGHSDVGRMAKMFTEARIRSFLRDKEIREATFDLMRTAIHIQAMIQKDLNAIGLTVENLKIDELKLRGE